MVVGKRVADTKPYTLQRDKATVEMPGTEKVWEAGEGLLPLWQPTPRIWVLLSL